MSTINLQDVMALRRKTGISIAKCKAALEKANGNMALAEKNIRIDGISEISGPSRPTGDGCVAITVGDDHSKCAIVEINTETDFTARNERFISMAQDIANFALNQPAGDVETTDRIQNRIDDLRLTTNENIRLSRGTVLQGGWIGTYLHHDRKTGVAVQVSEQFDDEILRKLCMHVASADPAPIGIDDHDIPADLLKTEQEIARAQATNSDKPADIVERIIQGKIAKYLDSVVLLRQTFVMDSDMKVRDLLPNGVTIMQFVKYSVGK